jgi:hypothetical protein
MTKLWSQPIRVETPQFVTLITMRTINGALWFVNNAALEDHVRAYLAKYCSKYDVLLYNVSFQGNHLHLEAQFPHANRAACMRDFNARVAEGVRKYVPEYPGGPLFERRYTVNVLPLTSDVEKYFFYCALQAVKDGLAERIGDYPGYNGVYDALRDRRRKYKLVRWGEYHARKRFNPHLTPADFTDTFELRFARVPGYETLSQAEYEKQMLAKLEERRLDLVHDHIARGYNYPNKAALRKVVPGTLPRKSKSGTRRPIVLCECYETKQKFLSWYFAVVESFLEASRKYRAGELDVEFPPMTYPPPKGLVT